MKEQSGVMVGMPAYLYLEAYGAHIWSAFGQPAFVVGSALRIKNWRDIDIRLILPDEEYADWGFDDPIYPFSNAKWVSLCLAYAALGKSMTGLPIDFQIQQMTLANKQYDGARSAIGVRLTVD